MSKKVSIKIEENGDTFKIDLNQQYQLIQLLEVIKEGHFVEDFNLAECCGFLIEETDQLFSDRKCILMDHVEQNAKLIFLRGKTFLSHQKKLEIKNQSRFIQQSSQSSQLSQQSQQQQQMISKITIEQTDLSQSDLNISDGKVASLQNFETSLGKYHYQPTLELLSFMPVNQKQYLLASICISNLRSFIYIVNYNKETTVGQIQNLLRKRYQIKDFLILNGSNQILNLQNQLDQFNYLEIYGTVNTESQYQIEVIVEINKNIISYQDVIQSQGQHLEQYSEILSSKMDSHIKLKSRDDVSELRQQEIQRSVINKRVFQYTNLDSIPNQWDSEIEIQFRNIIIKKIKAKISRENEIKTTLQKLFQCQFHFATKDNSSNKLVYSID